MSGWYQCCTLEGKQSFAFSGSVSALLAITSAISKIAAHSEWYRVDDKVPKLKESFNLRITTQPLWAPHLHDVPLPAVTYRNRVFLQVINFRDMFGVELKKTN